MVVSVKLWPSPTNSVIGISDESNSPLPDVVPDLLQLTQLFLHLLLGEGGRRQLLKPLLCLGKPRQERLLCFAVFTAVLLFVFKWDYSIYSRKCLGEMKNEDKILHFEMIISNVWKYEFNLSISLRKYKFIKRHLIRKLSDRVFSRRFSAFGQNTWNPHYWIHLLVSGQEFITNYLLFYCKVVISKYYSGLMKYIGVARAEFINLYLNILMTNNILFKEII